MDDRQQRIETALRESLAPAHLEVVNESDGHRGPPGRESHFRVVAVSDAFSGAPPVARHRRIYHLLADELAGGLHALSLQLHSPEEWREQGGAAAAGQSPPCRGG